LHHADPETSAQYGLPPALKKNDRLLRMLHASERGDIFTGRRPPRACRCPADLIGASGVSTPAQKFRRERMK